MQEEEEMYLWQCRKKVGSGRREEELMFGTRDAAQNWEAACTETILNLGFEVGSSPPSHLCTRKEIQLSSFMGMVSQYQKQRKNYRNLKSSFKRRS